MVQKLVAEVPSRIWGEARPPRMRVWENEFNVASWIRVSGGNGELALTAFHIDEAGEHTTLIDRTLIDGDGSALMSGLVRLRFTGEVELVQVHLKLGDAAMRFHVDELFFQRRGSNLRREDKLISNF
ncbi:MAG: hypothetical protein P1U67_06540 [Alcanivoracaceae bacterium]|nr:hypothetical protein [Alcanivoracaceae bacterium]